MYLTQYKEICEKQGWTFETCDNGKKVRITLTTLPLEHSFTVSKDSFAEQIKAVSESYLAKEYARIGHETSTTGKPISLAPFVVPFLKTKHQAPSGVTRKTVVC